MTESFTPAYLLRRRSPEPGDVVFVLAPRNMVLTVADDGGIRLPQVSELPGMSAPEFWYLGELSGTPCCGVKLPAGTEPAMAGNRLQFLDFKALTMQMSENCRKLLLRGKTMLDWLALRRFCGVCGASLENSEQEEARCCPQCGAKFFPKISPAVIVLISRGNEILLAHNRKFRDHVYSLIAGFVEPGESVEAAIAREVREEVGIEVGDLHYEGSQSWPFPDSLMLGFTAKYVSGEVRPDGEEITDAAFFPPDALPELPGNGSIARRIIGNWLRHNAGGAPQELQYQ